MAYSGPWIAKLKIEKDNFYISRGTRRIKLKDDYSKLAFEALISSKETHEGDDLLEHWVDGKWQGKKTP